MMFFHETDLKKSSGCYIYKKTQHQQDYDELTKLIITLHKLKRQTYYFMNQETQMKDLIQVDIE